jgi:hypothetical protein
MRIHACHTRIRRRIHACHMRRRIHACAHQSTCTAPSVPYEEEEDTCCCRGSHSGGVDVGAEGETV